VRCLVRIGDDVVVCTTNEGEHHPWPGGRRRPDETLQETACREVHEETGWLVDAESLQELGWLHFEHLNRQADDAVLPHPDFLQVVFTGCAVERAGDETWTDTEGYEISSCLVRVNEASERFAGDPLPVCSLARSWRAECRATWLSVCLPNGAFRWLRRPRPCRSVRSTVPTP
jgi:8-oxo-dGTP pyrophosphatase MutT (NUDIX family)